MASKKIIYFFMFIGSAIGGYIPHIWGATYFSFSSIIFNTIGALCGIWIGFMISR